jgi:hypothetical protein
MGVHSPRTVAVYGRGVVESGYTWLPRHHSVHCSVPQPFTRQHPRFCVCKWKVYVQGNRGSLTLAKGLRILTTIRDKNTACALP